MSKDIWKLIKKYKQVYISVLPNRNGMYVTYTLHEGIFKVQNISDCIRRRFLPFHQRDLNRPLPLHMQKMALAVVFKILCHPRYRSGSTPSASGGKSQRWEWAPQTCSSEVLTFVEADSYYHTFACGPLNFQVLNSDPAILQRRLLTEKWPETSSGSAWSTFSGHSECPGTVVW